MPEHAISNSSIAHETIVLETICPRMKFVASCHTNLRSQCDKTAYTLICIHANGTHKETWNPVIQSIFESDTSNIIRAVWTIDLPNHGDSAGLNEVALKSQADGLSISEMAKTIVALVNSPYLKGQRIILIGHSLGTSVCMYSTKSYPPNLVPYTAIILIEPPMIDRSVFEANIQDRKKQISLLTKGILSQKNFWENKETARQWLMKRFPWKKWDHQSLDLYLEHGLKDLENGVAVKCTREHEAACYTDFEATYQALDQISLLCHVVPIHAVFGEQIDLVPRYSQDSVVDSSKGRDIASITRIRDAGHMVVQEKPQAVGSAILDILNKVKSRPHSKL